VCWYCDLRGFGGDVESRDATENSRCGHRESIRSRIVDELAER
jgi:hypothetical protein